jgi:hypothetical protein
MWRFLLIGRFHNSSVHTLLDGAVEIKGAAGMVRALDTSKGPCCATNFGADTAERLL